MYSSNFQPEASLRWKRVQSVLQSINADAVLLNTNANLYYSSGRIFNGYTYIPSEGEAIYFVRRPIGLKGENVHYIHKPEQIPALLTEIGLPLPRKLAIEWDASHGDFTRLCRNNERLGCHAESTFGKNRLRIGVIARVRRETCRSISSYRIGLS